MTGDGLVNLDDVLAFVQALGDLAAYDAQGYVTNTDAAGDVSLDSTFDLGDIQNFSGLFSPPASVSLVCLLTSKLTGRRPASAESHAPLSVP